MKLLDCTLRDGGYYNAWNFEHALVNDYLEAMDAAGVDVVELGLRSLKNSGFKGASAYTTDEYLRSLTLPERLMVGVMVNGSELVGSGSMESALERLFPLSATESPVGLVRIACHVHEFEEALEAAIWLKSKGYLVGFNLMQVADRSKEEIRALAKVASNHALDVLYLADSMGSMNPEQTSDIISWLRSEWKGELGIHTHDNLGLALSNTLRALDNGVTWVDATVTGMGRGPGNSRTEELAIEIGLRRGSTLNIVPLMTIIRKYFKPMQQEYGWGTNPYYYLSGKYGIHPTYIQEMLSDSRFDEEDILAAIDHLKVEGGKKFSFNALEATRHFFAADTKGDWSPKLELQGRDVLIIGAGPSAKEHRNALVSYIKEHKPYVIVLNTQSTLPRELIDIRVASHPVRLLADCEQHTKLPQPLVTPVSMLPNNVRKSLGDKTLYDFGMQVKEGTFKCEETQAVLPNSLVISYALAIAASGNAKNIYLAGFDGFGAGDRRTQEMQNVFNLYTEQTGLTPVSITYTGYDILVKSVYGM